MKFSTNWMMSLSLSTILLVGCSSAPKKKALVVGPEMAPMMNPHGGPVPRTVMSDEYVKEFARNTYFWGWPLVNLHNRKNMMERVSEHGLVDGSVPIAPINQLTMQTDYYDHKERLVSCPNQDVVSGFGMMDLGRDAVVIQVPDFKDRYWTYQLGNQRTDAFAQLGKMYHSQPGFYLLVGPSWDGKIPSSIKKVFRSPTNISYAIPRVAMAGDPNDRNELLPILNEINMYPLAQFDGKIKTKNWAEINRVPSVSKMSKNQNWVKPETFFDDLGQVLNEVPSLPGEESLYQQMRAMLSRANANPKLKAALIREARTIENTLIKQASHFRNSGVPVKNQWNTFHNTAMFGRDYLTRTSAARANIFMDQPQEIKYFTTDFDSSRNLLNGKNQYTITFPKEMTPPVSDFWSITAYNADHFFDANMLSRYSRGSMSKDLVYNEDGSLTLHIQNQPPTDRLQVANWLPVGKGTFTLMIRAYSAKGEILDGKWNPPAVHKAQRTQISKAD